MLKELSEEQKAQILRVRGIREELGCSQERFAEITGISATVYKKIEAYERQLSLDCLKKIHNRLNVSVDYILFGEDRSLSAVWTNILNCSEQDKMQLFLRLYYYFTRYKARVFPTEDMQSMDIEKILEYINGLKNAESKDVT